MKKKPTKKKKSNLVEVDVPPNFEGEVSIIHTHVVAPKVQPLEFADLNTVKDKVNEIIAYLNNESR